MATLKSTAELLAEMVSNSTGKTYQILKSSRDGKVYCDCPGWKFSKQSPKSCKHLVRYYEDLHQTPHPVTPSTTWHVPHEHVAQAVPAGQSLAATLAAAMPGVKVAQVPTSLDHAIGLTRKMVTAGRLTLSAAVVQLMAVELAKHLPAPAPVAALPNAPLMPGKVRMISFDE